VKAVNRVAIAVFLSLALSACGSGSEEPTEPQAKSEQPIQELSVTVTDSGTEVSAPNIEAGPVSVTVQNETKKPYHPAFARLNDGVSIDEVKKKIQSEEVLNLITVAGSTVDAAKPGGQASVTVQFPEGEYIALDPESEIPFGPFQVTAADDPYEPVEADFDVEVGDFYFEVPDGITAGPATFAFTNAGEQSHEISFSREGDDEEDGWFVLAPSPGGSLWAEFDLKPGKYTAVCYFPDPKSGKPHVELGMKTTFTVR
jgi:plastocyanin